VPSTLNPRSFSTETSEIVGGERVDLMVKGYIAYKLRNEQPGEVWAVPKPARNHDRFTCLDSIHSGR
jgi:hypothetical protein